MYKHTKHKGVASKKFGILLDRLLFLIHNIRPEKLYLNLLIPCDYILVSCVT